MIENENWLIYGNELLKQLEKLHSYSKRSLDYNDAVDDAISVAEIAPAVDAVPVDKVIFHRLTIDKKTGIPELTLQLGERKLVIQTDPVNVMDVCSCNCCTQNDREKLIDILEEIEGQYNNEPPSLEQMADGLIAHGVTIRR